MEYGTGAIMAVLRMISATLSFAGIWIASARGSPAKEVKVQS